MKLIIIISLILILFSGNAVAEWNVTWTPVKESIIDKEYIITVQNMQTVKRDVNISSFFAETNFDISGVSDVKFYEWKDVPYTYTVDHYDEVECSKYYPDNDTWTYWTESIFNYTETVESVKLDWKACKAQLFKETGTTKEDNYGFINIPACGSKPKDDGTYNGTKIFKLTFRTPVVYDGTYGSFGKVALLLDGVEHHPYWNTSWSTRKEVILTGHSSLSLNNPIEDGYIYKPGYVKYTGIDITSGVNSGVDNIIRGYIEWDISSLPSNIIIDKMSLQYHGHTNAVDCHVHEMMNTRPSTSGNQAIYDEIGEGTVYADVAGFPIVGSAQEIDLGSNAISDLESSLSNGWFAVGIQADDEVTLSQITEIYSEEYTLANPKPTLYIEYSLTDYQILLNVSYETGMQTDFDDLRFCNDTHEIDSWLESKVNSVYALVWVEFPTTPSNGVNQTYYKYYGNDVVSSIWDGDETFLQYHGAASSNFLDSVAPPYENIAIRVKWKRGATTNTWWGLGTVLSDGGGDQLVFKTTTTHNGWYYWKKNDGGTSDMEYGDPGYDMNWHITDLFYNGSQSLTCYIDDVHKGTSLASSVNNPNQNMGLGMHSWSGTAEQNWSFVRKYVDNPPTATFGITQYYVNSIHYNTADPYNHTIDSNGIIAINRTITAIDDINWTAAALTNDCHLVVTEYNRSNTTLANFTVSSNTINWLQITNLTPTHLYRLQYANGTEINLTNADANGIINYTEDFTPDDYQLVVGNTSVTITLHSSSPCCIYTNYTGIITGSYLIKSYYPLNYSSLAFLMGVNHTPTSDMHAYLKPPATDIADGVYRAHNRNNTPYLSWEYNDTITEGNVWKWAGGDNDSFWIAKSTINATHTWINITGIASNVFPSMFYIDRGAMYSAPKTGFEINQHQGIIIKTWDLEQLRGRNNDYYISMWFDTMLESTAPTENLEIWYCNDTFDPLTDDPTLVCDRKDSWTGSRWMDHEAWQPHNNVSYCKPLVISADISTCSCPPTEIDYIYITSETLTSKSYILNATNYDPGITNISYAETETMWLYNELSGVSTPLAYTPSFYMTFVRDYEEYLHHLYIANNQDVWGHSDINNIGIGISDIAPTHTVFNYFWWDNTTDYNMNSSYEESFWANLTYGFDPDNDAALTHVLSLYDDDYNFIAFINSSLVGNQTDDDVFFDIDDYKAANRKFKLKIVSTDNEGSTSSVWSKTFELPADNRFYKTIRILKGFPTVLSNTLSTFLSYLPLFIGILVGGALILLTVGIFSKFKRW